MGVERERACTGTSYKCYLACKGAVLCQLGCKLLFSPRILSAQNCHWYQLSGTHRKPVKAPGIQHYTRKSIQLQDIWYQVNSPAFFNRRWDREEVVLSIVSAVVCFSSCLQMSNFLHDDCARHHFLANDTESWSLPVRFCIVSKVLVNADSSGPLHL